MIVWAGLLLLFLLYEGYALATKEKTVPTLSRTINRTVFASNTRGAVSRAEWRVLARISGRFGNWGYMQPAPRQRGRRVSEQQQIREPKRKYFTSLPNLYDDAGLDPYEFRLLAHYARVGDCYETTRTTAKRCGMSLGQVVQKRRALHNKGWILLEKRESTSVRITVIDKWKDNMAKYAERSPHEQVVSPHEQQRSPGDTKEEPFKKNHKEENFWEKENA